MRGLIFHADYFREFVKHKNGAAIKVSHLPTLAFKLTELLHEPQRLDRMRSAARRLGRPRAAFDVVEQSLAILAVNR